MGHDGEVMCLLHRARSEHGETGRAAAHHVLMVAEDAQSVRSNSAASDMKYGREQLSGNLEHVWQHQHQTLRGREGRGERTGYKRAVCGACRAELRLHLPDLHRRTEDVEPSGNIPFIGNLTHRCHRSDGIYGCYLAQGIGDIGCGCAAVDNLFAHKRYYL